MAEKGLSKEISFNLKPLPCETHHDLAVLLHSWRRIDREPAWLIDFVFRASRCFVQTYLISQPLTQRATKESQKSAAITTGRRGMETRNVHRPTTAAIVATTIAATATSIPIPVALSVA
jgi:hypothetical protein